MKIQQSILISSIILILLACNGKKDIKVSEEFGQLSPQLVNALQSIAPKVQNFIINPNKANTIIGRYGTILIIPADGIVDQNGNQVKTEVKLVLKEHFSKSDYFLSNLQTVQNDQLLQSGGMIYFNAYDKKGNPLKIANGKSIRIEIPNNGKIKNPNIYLGKRDEKGLVNWGEKKETTKSLLAYPILYISSYNFPEGYGTECSEYYGIVNRKVPENESDMYTKGDISKFEKTLLATREFKERYDTYCERELLDLYIQNLDKNLWEIDEMFVKKAEQDSIESVQFMTENLPSMVEEDKNNNHFLIQAFKDFAAQKLTRVDPNLIADSSVFKDYTASFDSYENIYRAKSAFNALEFGWINLDVIYQDPRSVEMELNVETDNEPSTVTLILKDKDVMLNANSSSDNFFSFTTKEEGYNKLPKGAKGILLAIGYKKKEIVFAMKEIIIGKNVTENLKLKPITAKELEKKLKLLN